MIVCKSCKRQLRWTASGQVTCPAGHMGYLGVATKHGIADPAGFGFRGGLADLREITQGTLDQVEELAS